MRSAQPEQPPTTAVSLPNDGRATASSNSSSNEPKPRWQSRWGVWVVAAAIIALAGMAASLFFVLRGGPAASPSHAPPPTSPAAPPRTAFAFPLTATSFVTTGKRNGRAVSEAAGQVQTTLSGFYDAAFMDPNSRKDGLPASAWNAFARAVQEQARSDASSLTLGETGADIDTLSVTDATLSVRVLLDPRGRPQAAVANVALDASGTLKGGEAVVVTNRASFLLRPVGANWVVVGYPAARTDIQTPTPSPSGSGSPTPRTSASPSPGASP
jgi:hypothetical protein